MTDVRLSMRVMLSLTLGVLSIPSWASAAITAVPPADLRSAPGVKSSEVHMKLSSGAPAVRIVLPEPTSAERDVLKARNAQTSPIGVKKTTTKRSLAIAFPRDVPADSKVVQL